MSQLTARRPHHHHKTAVKEPCGDKPLLATYATVCRAGDVQASEDFGGTSKIQSPLLQGPGTFRLGPAESHIIYVPPKIKELNRRERVVSARQGVACHPENLLASGE